MTAEEKQFAVDLLRALDEGMGTDTHNISDDHYKESLQSCHREIKRTIRQLIAIGYKKCPNQPQ